MSDNTDNADNTALIAEARAWAKDAARVGRNIVRDVDSGILFARRLSDALEAALAAAGVTQPEPEYEYRLVLELHPPKHAAWDQAETLWYPTAEEARATGKARDWIAHYRIDYPRAKFTERVERRIVAGEPETAPNQEGQP